MASPLNVNVDWGDLVTTTLEARSGELNDLISNNNALLKEIEKRGMKRDFEGGREIVEELAYAMNQTFMWYSGYEPLNISLNDTMTAMRVPLKQASIAVTVSGLEKIQNSGKAAQIKLVTARTNNAIKTFRNYMSAAVYSDGTGWSGKQLTGLNAAIAKTPTTGIYGGIDRSAYPWWRNVSINANTDSRGVVTSSNIASYFATATLGAKRDSEGIEQIVCDTNYYTAFLTYLQGIQRITEDPDGDAGAGFTSLAYYGAGKKARVILDGGYNGQIPTNTAYFLNPETYSLVVAPERNYSVIGGDRSNVNQDAIVRILAWAGNLVCMNPSLNAVLWQ